MTNLKAKPFNLKDEDIKWVKETLKNMDLKEKVGQLFFPVGLTDDRDYLKAIIENIKPSGIMYRPEEGSKIQAMHRFLQENSKIPLLIAANLESGGNGIAADGTFYGKQMQVAATDDKDMAYKLGLVSGREGRAVGCNWAFAPVIDIDMNFRNPITNVRTYGSDPKRVLKMAKAYMKGIHENGLAVSIKHFPGDGVDERDQHLVTSINSLSTEDWDNSYGMIYKGMIDEGAHTVMVGHIMQPAYSRKLVPGIKDEEIMPATLAPELLQGLLREKLGFNGLIVTDASLMAGFAVAERREIAVPKAIASGCDMFLFNRSIEEDFMFMMKGIENGILTLERIDEAVTRILGVKASLGLHLQKNLVPEAGELSVLKCEEHVAWAKECADKAVTLVKDTQNLLPINPETHKRVVLYVLGDEDGLFGGTSISKYFETALRAKGFEVTLFDKKNLDFSDLIAPISGLREKYDLALYFANLETASNQTTVRINWAPPMGADLPWFVKELPTMFISTANPYHLQDVPMVKTYINAYSSSEYIVDAVIEKIMGKSEFKGINPVDPFCNCWEAKL